MLLLEASVAMAPSWRGSDMSTRGEAIAFRALWRLKSLLQKSGLTGGMG
jgi:hypothetical protein